jgi:hypothetical protein
MVMDVLERSMETDAYHERDPRAFDDYQMRDVSVIRSLIESSRFEYFIIKALCESQNLYRLMEDYRPSKSLWVVRNFDDTVNSMMISFPGFKERIKLIAKDRNSCGWRGEGMSDETHELIREHVSESTNEATAAALKWYYRNILFFEQGLDVDDRVKLILYEKLVSCPDVEVKAIFDFLGIEFHPRVIRWVSPRSIRKRPTPDIAPDVREICEMLQGRFQDLYMQKNNNVARIG